jgi:hypothetical protein
LEKIGYDPNNNLNLLRTRINELRADLGSVDPYILSKYTDSQFNQYDQSSGEYILPMWGRQIKISYPDFIVKNNHSNEELDVATQALVLYHFITTDGTPEIGRWISFADLPDGRFYNSAFQGYTGGELARKFGSDRNRFETAAQISGGTRELLGDAAYRFSLFPRVPLIAVLWEGDEDFPTSYRILFDASVPNHMPTDACAIAGSMLSRRLIKAV